jgi:hypothetical protein
LFAKQLDEKNGLSLLRRDFQFEEYLQQFAAVCSYCGAYVRFSKTGQRFFGQVASGWPRAAGLGAPPDFVRKCPVYVITTCAKACTMRWAFPAAKRFSAGDSAASEPILLPGVFIQGKRRAFAYTGYIYSFSLPGARTF